MSRFKRKMASRQPPTINILSKKQVKAMVMLWADNWREIQHWCSRGTFYFQNCPVPCIKLSSGYNNTTTEKVDKFKAEMMSAEIDKLVQIGTVSLGKSDGLKAMLVSEDVHERLMCSEMVTVLREQRNKDK